MESTAGHPLTASKDRKTSLPRAQLSRRSTSHTVSGLILHNDSSSRRSDSPTSQFVLLVLTESPEINSPYPHLLPPKLFLHSLSKEIFLQLAAAKLPTTSPSQASRPRSWEKWELSMSLDPEPQRKALLAHKDDEKEDAFF